MNIERFRHLVHASKTDLSAEGASPSNPRPAAGSAHDAADAVARGSEPGSWEMAAPSFMIVSLLPRK
ncbi:hypothetical protein OHS33_26795 [Streptomyces sp. NBC_00536]|uniref:hypothetical protein n=1 Tax=Streptomyces sp. NBC_00536 TaxID=2975769 RepID=UPI002E81D99E|nr:hypothetical protein [Streptomyces sp. NBC_00536]WUC81625.1 hypothetical protein OHS33_26795 [Streptomyces sp. NBC_00536]